MQKADIRNRGAFVGMNIQRLLWDELKAKMAECVRQNFPSAAQQEQERHFTFRSGDPEEDKNRQSEVQDLDWDTDHGGIVLKEYTRRVRTHCYLLSHVLNEPFFWIMFIIQVLIRVWTREEQISVRIKLLWHMTTIITQLQAGPVSDKGQPTTTHLHWFLFSYSLVFVMKKRFLEKTWVNKIKTICKTSHH